MALLLSSWPGLSRPSTVSRQGFKKVIPSCIGGQDQPDLACSRPVLDVFFALNGAANIVVDFKVDKAFEGVPLGETLNRFFAMFGNSVDKIARDTDIQNAVGFVREYVDISGHGPSVSPVDGWDKPGHDEEFGVSM